MKINWMLRLKNKVTLTALIGILLTAIFQIAQLFGLNLTVSQEQIMGVVEVVLTILGAWGIIVDPTTAGAGDSEQALSYKEPKTDGANVDDTPTQG